MPLYERNGERQHVEPGSLAHTVVAASGSGWAEVDETPAEQPAEGESTSATASTLAKAKRKPDEGVS